MTDIKKSLDIIAEEKSKLNKYFDNNIFENIVDMTNYYWTLEGFSSVGFSDENPFDNKELLRQAQKEKWEELEHVYSEEVRGVVRKDKYTLVTIHTCTGNGCEDLIFDNSKEISLRFEQNGN